MRWKYEETKKFLWFLRTHKGVYLAPHPVVGLVLQIGDMQKFPHALGFASRDFILFLVSKQGPWFITVEKDGGDKRLEETVSF